MANRKVFISFLGYSNYGKCRYRKGRFLSDDVRFIQVATLDYLQTLEEWTEEDVAYILLTKGAKERNWVDNGQPAAKTGQKGLAACLKEKNYPFKVEAIEGLPDGKDEGELFEVFKSVFSVLQPKDRLYFDVTHGFRSLPMLVLVLINYAKFLLKAEVKSITYGNYEARIRMGEQEGMDEVAALIIDLLPLSQMQDWTFATADFLKNGNVEKFEELANAYKESFFVGNREGDKRQAVALERLVKQLRTVIDSFQTCRGKEILGAKSIARLKESVKSIGEMVIEPLNPVIGEIDSAFAGFEANVEYRNGFEAVRWCVEHNLYQQAATILQENVVSFFCRRYGLALDDEKERKWVNWAFDCLKKRYAQEISELEFEGRVGESPWLEMLVTDSLLARKEVVDAFCLLTDARNDINHSGMRKQPFAAATIRAQIKNAQEVLERNWEEVASGSA